MKIKVDGVQILDLSDTKKKVIKNDIFEESFDEDMIRRIKYIIEHKYERCMEHLKQEWEPKLRAAGVEMIPTDPDALAELIFHNHRIKTDLRENKSEIKKTKTQQKIKKVMHEYREGELRSGSGRKVSSRKQAVAIALSESRKAKK